MTAASRTLDRMYFSYSQFFVFDRSVKFPAVAWTQAHIEQGFARREANAAFSTLLEYGHAEVTVRVGPFASSDGYQRVVEVPLAVPSGVVVVAGPEEFEDDRIVQLTPGPYRLTVAQSVIDADTAVIDVWFELLPSAQLVSRVLVADGELRPPDVLIETADEVVLD